MKVALVGLAGLALIAPADAGRSADRTPPTAPRVVGPRVTTDPSPAFRFSARDRRTPVGRLRYRCSFDSAALHPCGRRYSERLGIGIHVLRVRALDRAGNRSAVRRVVVTIVGKPIDPPPPASPAPPPAPPPPPPPAAPETLSVSVSGAGTVTSSPAGISCPSACVGQFSGPVTLSPAPAEGFRFAGWEGDCTGAASCEVSMTGARSVVARFEAISWSVTVTVLGPGQVRSDDGRIECPNFCSASYGFQTSVRLTAMAAIGSSFTGWSGSQCSDASMICTLVMVGDQAVTATFTLP